MVRFHTQTKNLSTKIWYFANTLGQPIAEDLTKGNRFETVLCRQLAGDPENEYCGNAAGT